MSFTKWHWMTWMISKCICVFCVSVFYVLCVWILFFYYGIDLTIARFLGSRISDLALSVLCFCPVQLCKSPHLRAPFSRAQTWLSPLVVHRQRIYFLTSISLLISDILHSILVWFYSVFVSVPHLMVLRAFSRLCTQVTPGHVQGAP